MSDGIAFRIFDVEHGACAMLAPVYGNVLGKLAMIDSGHSASWRPSTHIRHALGRTDVDYLFVTNADQDHVSDLQGLREHDIKVKNLVRNPHPNPVVLRQIKLEGGQLTDDMEYFLSLHQSYNQPVIEPFNDYMGGARVRTFYNTYPDFTCTNDLSLVTFIEYNGFKIIFPGDITKAGWLALLEQQAFCDELRGVTVMVASHHGRHNGYCAEVFDYCAPQAVIISDKAIQHATQKETTGYYRNHVISNHNQGVLIANLDYPRYVLTTRNDGHIDIFVQANGEFNIWTESASLQAA